MDEPHEAAGEMDLRCLLGNAIEMYHPVHNPRLVFSHTFSFAATVRSSHS